MNLQPFDPFDPFAPSHPETGPAAETMTATGASPAASTAPSAFFDHAGLLWMMACVAIAAAAGHWVPRLTEPGSWPGSLRNIGWVAPSATALQDQSSGPKVAPAGPAGVSDRSAMAANPRHREAL